MSPAPPPDGPPSTFLDELAEAFRRHRPQGTLRWNFAAAFSRLDELIGRLAPQVADDEHPGADPSPVPAGRSAVLSRRLRRGTGNLRALATDPPGPKATADHGHAELAEVTEALGAVLEALRFLAARAEVLERAAAVGERPVAGTAWLLPPPRSGPWSGPLLEWLAAAPVERGVVLAECGDGDLATALGGAGLPVTVVEPRGALAWPRAVDGLTVGVEEAPAFVAGRPPASVGALVLSGFVDRAPLPEIVGLLDAARACLVPGGAIAVLAGDPGAVAADWPAPALDLLPGRPLHAETWRLLLERAEFTEVGTLPAPAALAPGCPVAAVAGRRR